MNIFIRRLPILLVLALFASSAAGSVESDTIKRSFDVRPGGTLFVDIDRGNVTVESTSGNTVHVELERSVRDVNADEAKDILARNEWDISLDGNDVIVESRFDDEDGSRWSARRWRNGDRVRISVTIRVPEEYNIDFNTGAGTVQIANLEGTVDGRTGAGNITIGEIDGDVEIRSGSGNVQIDGVDGELRVSSGAGNIRLGYVAGEVRANTGAGNITARITDQPSDDSLLESGAGNVTVFLEGDIGVDVSARASVGSASCDFGLRVEGKWMSKSFEGSINGGGPDLTLRSGVGNVSLKRL